jgi:site-specific recombinase XerD
MLGERFDTPLRTGGALCDGRGGSLLEGFAQWLRKAGYAAITVRKHIRGAEHFSHWTDRKRIPVGALDEQVLERFDHHLCRCRCPGYRYWAKLRAMKSARLFLEHLCDRGVINACIAEPTTKEPALLTAFCQWMCEQRSAGDSTLRNYSRWIREFLKGLGEDPRKFDAGSLRAFVLTINRQRGWVAAKHTTTALRMFLRFLIAHGRCAAGLAAMLIRAVESYLAVRRACGFDLRCVGYFLRSFARFSKARTKDYVCAATAIEWAGLAPTVRQRARRLGHVIRFSRYLRAEDPRHEIPPTVFGSEDGPRSIPYIFSPGDVGRLVQATSESYDRTLRRGRRQHQER